MNRAIIGLGSNIAPEDNIKKAREALSKEFHVLAQSAFKQTAPVGPVKQADFINGSVLVETDISMEQLKARLGSLETALGRIRPAERFGPRTIDLDIIVFNGKIIDQDFYSREYLKESVLELIPNLTY